MSGKDAEPLSPRFVTEKKRLMMSPAFVPDNLGRVLITFMSEPTISVTQTGTQTLT
ncbi:hypothetical protein Lgee_2127 [Legionella geestiana]|uniref:Uncharacterized protein n=1 Tax=Legionella geestiana TaxID=45065 RepID=A0A0W0TNH4_9GAMM|nr:hypothetical protein Lgee_2127 [Legionella geestiana]STX53826.1 Uncharacterised protein [Legionella geestiana]